MAAINDANLSEYVLTDADADTVRAIIRGALWSWYRWHKDDIVIKKLWFIWRVKDIRFIFVALLGDEPA